MATGMPENTMRRGAPSGRHRLHRSAATAIALASLILPVLAKADDVRDTPVQRTTVSVDGGLLTLAAQDASLRSLLQDLSMQAGIEIHLDPRFEDSIITASFRSRPLEPVLRGLLSAYDTFFVYRAPDELQPASLRAIWVFPWGASEGLIPQQPPSKSARCGDLLAGLQSPDATQRVRALEFLAESDDGFAIEALQGALRDDNELVRYEAIMKLGQRGVSLREADVFHILSTDPSPLVRQQALENLVETLGAADMRVKLAAQAAVNDDDLTTRQRAQAIVDLCNTPPDRPVAADEVGAVEPVAAVPDDGAAPDEPAGTEVHP
jgi:hypothetical protein